MKRILTIWLVLLVLLTIPGSIYADEADRSSDVQTIRIGVSAKGGDAIVILENEDGIRLDRMKVPSGDTAYFYQSVNKLGEYRYTVERLPDEEETEVGFEGEDPVDVVVTTYRDHEDILQFQTVFQDPESGEKLDGIVYTTKKQENPKTGDMNDGRGWLLAVICSIFGMAALLLLEGNLAKEGRRA